MKMFVSKSDEKWEWRMHFKKDLHSSYCSIKAVNVIKYRRLRCLGDVFRMREVGFWFKKITSKSIGRRPLRKPKHRWEKILEWIVKKEEYCGLIWLRIYILEEPF